METTHQGNQGGAGSRNTPVAGFTLEEIEAEIAQLREEREAKRTKRWDIVKATKASGLSAPHLGRLCRTERLDAIKINGAWYIEPSSLLEWMRRQ